MNFDENFVKLKQTTSKLAILNESKNGHHLIDATLDELNDVIFKVNFSQVDMKFLNELLTNICDCVETFSLNESQAKIWSNIIRLIFETNRVDLNEKALIKLMKQSSISYELKGFFIENRLKRLTSNQLDENLFKNKTFLNDLEFISIEMNGKQCESFDFQIFVKFDSFGFLVRFFSLLIKQIDVEQEDNDETYEMILKDLLEIFYELLRHRSLNYVENFVKENMFEEILVFLSDSTLVEYFFDRYVSMFYKIMCIFQDITRGIHFITLYSDSNFIFKYFSKDTDYLTTLNNIKSLLGKIYFANKHEKYLREKSFYKVFLKSLAYLDKLSLYKSNQKILSIEDYRFIALSAYTAVYFKEITDEFKKISEIVEWEFINEFNQKEEQKVTRITNHFGRILNNSSNYFVRSIRHINDIFTTDETKVIAYEAHKYFFKSIIFYGLNIERILCLACLLKFIHIGSIREDLFGDVSLIEYLKMLENQIKKDTLQETKNQNGDLLLNKRLLNGIKEFLNKGQANNFI